MVGSLLLKSFVFQAFYVPSSSMENTLQVSDRFFVSRMGGEIRHGDIVVFYDAAGWMADSDYDAALRSNAWTRFLKMNGFIPSQNNEVMVKRAIGLPGDTVACCNAHQQVTVNGVGLDERYLQDGMLPSAIRFEVTVPEAKLFLMGDNRAHSADSRRFLDHPSGGFVRQEDVIGRAVATVWPVANATWHRTPVELMQASP